MSSPYNLLTMVPLRGVVGFTIPDEDAGSRETRVSHKTSRCDVMVSKHADQQNLSAVPGIKIRNVPRTRALFSPRRGLPGES